jgi:hypothetical protein
VRRARPEMSASTRRGIASSLGAGCEASTFHQPNLSEPSPPNCRGGIGHYDTDGEPRR